VISVASHWAGVHMAEMVAAAEKGDLGHASEVNRRLLASYDFETSDAAPNPIPTKTMMRVMGHAVGQCRLPMGPAPAGLEDEARRVLANLQRG
jgi:4-hydroxy-tetrahydrodipicolinate synthase